MAQRGVMSRALLAAIAGAALAEAVCAEDAAPAKQRTLLGVGIFAGDEVGDQQGRRIEDRQTLPRQGSRAVSPRDL